MLTGIDHLVVVVPDLDAGIEAYERLGFTVVRGGRHPIGTHNALMAFADGSYLELIAFYRESPEHRWWAPLARGGGLVDFCLATDDLRGDTAAFREAGVAIDDPRAMSRLRPDGYQVRWVLALPRGDHRGVAPFLIEDETPRVERVPRLTTHVNGVTGIATVTVSVEDLATVRRWYPRVTGQPGQPIERPDLDGAGMRFSVGPHTLDFVAPRGSRGALRDWLAARGASPYAASLTAASGHAGWLDPAQTLGARIWLGSGVAF